MQHLEGSGTPVLYIGRKVLEGKIRWVSHGTCSYICMYIYAVANSVMLQGHLHDFYNVNCM